MSKDSIKLQAALQIRRLQKQIQLANKTLAEGNTQSAANILAMAQVTADGLLAYSEAAAEPAPRDIADELAERLERALEDRAEIEPVEVKPAQPPGVVVVPALNPLTLVGQKKEIAKSWTGIAGTSLPLILAPDIQDAIERFRLLMPHAVSVFVRAIGLQQAGEPIRLRPLLLVGDQGSGKTTTARTIADILGAPSEIHGMAGASDSSTMGTSSQWHSARENSTLQFIKRCRCANPVIVWDEIEKASTSRHNGSATEAILPLLEGHTACRYRDLALEIEVDLSHLSHIATANSLEGIPGPLLDRFTIIQMPVPEWQHIGVLSRSILDKLAAERGLRPEWFPDLSGDEIEALRTVWDGGSIRRLEKAIRAYIARRDDLLPRA